MTERIAMLALALALAAPGVRAQALDPAQARIAQRDFAGAAVLLERHLAAAPEDPGARLLLARVHAWNGEPGRALPLYRALLAKTPDDVDMLLGYGQALLWSGDAAAAVPVLERARRLSPAYADVGLALGQARAAVSQAAPSPTAGAVASGAEEMKSTAAVAPMASPVPSPQAGGAAPMAPTASRDRRSLALSARHERLDRGRDPWRSLRLDALMLPAGRTGGYGALVAEERFGLRDAGLEAGIVVPLGRGWTMQPEVGLVADADFLPRHYLDLRLQRVLEGGWIGTASLRHSAYRDVDVQRLALGVERYAGAWRAAYTLNLTRLAGDESVGHDLRLARAYGERSEVGLQVGFGREAALIGPQVVASDVRATVLFGRHAVGAWALLWNVGRVRQGVLYTREGLGLGLERRF